MDEQKLEGILLAEKICRQFSGGILIEISRAEIHSKSRLLISGPSGCGKSTALGMLSMTLKPDYAKNFQFKNQNILNLWRQKKYDHLAKLRAENLGFIPQTAGLIPFLSVLDNITLTQQITGRKDDLWLKKLVKRLGIQSVLSHYPEEISIGQRQRVAVARALVHRPLLVLADEPTASVHPSLADEILQLLLETVEEIGAALVITSHDTQRGLAHGLTEVQCQTDQESQTTRLLLNE